MAWSTVTIGDYLVQTELRDPTKRPRDRFFYVDVSSVDKQTFAIRQPAELLGAEAPSRARKVIRERDVLFATVRPTLRRIAMVDSALDDQICSTGFCVLRAGPKLDAGFLYYWLLTDGVVEHVAKIEKGVSYPAIRDSDVKAIRMPYPPLDEQRQVAVVLSAVQRAMEWQQRLIVLSAELKKALMYKLFTEGTRGEPVKQTEIGPVPESWTVAPLAQFTESFQYGTSVKCGYNVKGSPVLRIPNVVGGHLDVSDLKFGHPKKNELQTVRLRPGDLLFVRTNGVRENAGRCSMYRSELGDSCYFASYLIRVRLRDGLMPEFLEEYTRTETGVRLLAGRAARTADGKFNINTGTLETLLVPKPDIDEQKVIADALALVDKKARNHAASKATLEALFRTLLHQLMTAQVRIHDLDLSALEAAEQEPVGAV
jgi:type I restriction enzyme S subunit